MRISAVLLASSALVACGGGGGSSSDRGPELQTGNLTGIKGVGYSTPSRSGVTGDNGEYSFISGETVTFSLGGSVLLETAAGKDLSLIDILNLPQNERDFRATAAYYDTANAFSKGFHIVQTLWLLDNDNDLSNGADLGNYHEVLANDVINFDLPIYEYIYPDGLIDRLNLNTATGRGFDNAKGLPQLYTLAGRKIPAHAVSTETEYRDNLSQPSRRTEISYDETGRKIRTIAFSGENDLQRSTTTWQYNAQDQLTQRMLVNERKADGVYSTTSKTTYSTTYNAAGNVLTYETLTDVNGDGTRINRELSTTTYNDQGLQSLNSRQTDNNNDGTIERTIETHYEYNAQGQRTNYLYQTDNDGNGQFESGTRILTEYNEQGQYIRQEVRRLSNGDVTSITINAKSYETTADGNKNTTVTNTDSDADGNTDSLATSVITRTRIGQYGLKETNALRLNDTDADGTNDRSSEERTTYNELGRKLTDLTLNDNNLDGTIDSSSTETYTYDNEGRSVSRVTENDSDHDGNAENRSTRSYAYGDFGITERLDQSDTDADGTANNQYRTSYTYNAEFGYRTRYQYDRDDDADGVYVPANATTYEVTVIPDGIQYLLSNTLGD